MGLSFGLELDVNLEGGWGSVLAKQYVDRGDPRHI